MSPDLPLPLSSFIIPGFSGYNTTLAQYLTANVLEGCSGKNTLLFTIWFGANDATRPLPEGTE